MSHPWISPGLPWIHQDASEKWLGKRLFLWSSALEDLHSPTNNIHAIVSSRLTGMESHDQQWRSSLRNVISSIQSNSEWLLTAQGCTLDRLLAHLPQELCPLVIRFVLKGQRPLSDIDSCVRWCRKTLDYLSRTSLNDTVLPVFVSPEFAFDAELLWQRGPWTRVGIPFRESTSCRAPTEVQNNADETISQDLLDQLPLADRLCFAGANSIHVLKKTLTGNISALLELRSHDHGLLQPAVIQHYVMLAVPDAATRATEKQASLDPIATGHDDDDADDDVDDVFRNPQEWLCHWTRDLNRPWPDEKKTQWVSRVLGNDNDMQPHSSGPLATLLRIIKMKRLVGSPLANRGQHPVVCFTEVPLSEFRNRRVYRRHRRRFDFELYGIAIRKETLKRLGARPVIYGPVELWENLSETDRPFFQKSASNLQSTPASTTAGSATRQNRSWQVMDFAAEREWRIPGDIDLGELNVDDVRIFVDTAAEQIQLHNRPFSTLTVPNRQL